MSVKIMGIVWDCDLPRNEKYILLAYADHADHEGGSIFPSVGRVAWKTGYNERMVQRITQGLITKGVLVKDGTSKYSTNLYRIDVEKLPVRPDYNVENVTPPPGKMSPPPRQNVTPPPGKMSPKPSIEPSGEPSIEGVNKKIDYLEHFTSMEGKVSEATAVNPADQWFASRDPVLKIYEQVIGWGNNQEQRRIRREAILTGVTERGTINLDVWKNSIKSSVGHGVGPANIIRFWEVYDCGGDYNVFTQKTFRSGNNGKGEYVEVDGKRIMI